MSFCSAGPYCFGYNTRPVAIDLYSADLKTISGSTLYQAICDFTRLDLLRDDRPREGYLLDFKEDLSDRFLHSVAAFANTFGGLMVVGVSEADGRPEKLLGVAPRGELKTQVASFIASNLFPCPPFEIAECDIPGNSDKKKLCVVRVRETQEICLIAKKGNKLPIYVRVEDQSAPAGASQIRALLIRKRQDANPGSDTAQRVQQIQERLTISTYSAGARTNLTSQTFFKIVVCPYNAAPLRLDLATEGVFGRLVGKKNPGLEHLAQQSPGAKVEFDRWRDWFWVRLEVPQHRYERRWELTNRGDIGFATQTQWPLDGGDVWSLYDVTADLALVLALAREFSQHTGYYGNFQLQADLRTGGLRFEPGLGAFDPLFYKLAGSSPGFSLDSRAIQLVGKLRNTAQVEIDLDYTGLGESLSQTVTTVVNQLLRCFGHTADFVKLQQAIDQLVGWVGASK